MTDRIKRLYSKIITTGQHISIDKFKIILQTESTCANWPPILRRAQTLANILDHMPIIIPDDEFIIGNPASHPWGLEIEAGLGKWDKSEIDALRADGFAFDKADEEELLTLNEQYQPFGLFDAANLVVEENDILDTFAQSGIVLAPWKKDKSLSNRVGGGTACAGLGLGPGYGLICIDYELPLKKGLLKMIEEIDGQLQENTYFGERSFERGVSLKAMKRCLEAMIRYAERCALAAQEKALKESNAQRRDELLAIADICRRVPAYPARTFREAIQCVWFIFLVMCPSPTAAWGRFDQYMFPFYKADLEAGCITPEEALEYIEGLRIRSMEMNQQPGKEGRKRYAGGARWMNMTIGGVKPDGSDATNELSYLVLDAVMDCPTIHHTVTIRVADSTPDSLLIKGAECLAAGRSMPAFVSDKAYIDFFTQPGNAKDGLTLEEARDFCLTGCIDGNVPGVTCTRHVAMFVVLLAFDIFMHNGWDRRIQQQVGHQHGPLSRFQDYADFEKSFLEELRYFMELAGQMAGINCSALRNLLPEPVKSVFMKDGIRSGFECFSHTDKPFINAELLNPIGMVNLAQALYSIRKLVFEEKALSLDELLAATDADWVGFEALQKKILSYPHYGNDLDEIDALVTKLYRFWADTTNSIPSALGGNIRPTAISITSHQPGGALTGATPDGRFSGEILCDACASPMRGMDTNGPLSMLKSAMKLPQNEFQAFLLNMKLHPSCIKTTDDMQKLASLIRTYFNGGGSMLQFNVVTEQTLRQAQTEPEKHKDLVVRVAGYSTYFVGLNKTMQDEVISRTAHQF